MTPHHQHRSSPSPLKQLRQRHGFRLLRMTSIPMGHRGIPRLVNTHKLNTVVSAIIPEAKLEAFRERVGLGWTLVALAQR